MSFEIRRYAKAEGTCPADEWMDGLSVPFKMRVIKGVAKLEAGNFGNCKAIQGATGLFELRLDFGPGYRLYFGRDGQTLVILLCGGDKSSQRRDIERAKGYWKDYNSGDSQ